jgi:hypothetical protein
MLVDMNTTFKHSVVTSAQVEAFMIGYNATTRSLLHPSLFDQYLRSTRVPVLEYAFVKRRLWMRWGNAVPGLKLPVRTETEGRMLFVAVDEQWQAIPIERRHGRAKRLSVDADWYVGARRLSRREARKGAGIQRAK